MVLDSILTGILVFIGFCLVNHLLHDIKVLVKFTKIRMRKTIEDIFFFSGLLILVILIIYALWR